MGKKADYVTTIEHFFNFVKEGMKDGNKVVVRACKLCQREYSGHRNMNSNFVSHLKHYHKNEFNLYLRHNPKIKVKVTWAAPVNTVQKVKSEPKHIPSPTPKPLPIPEGKIIWPAPINIGLVRRVKTEYSPESILLKRKILKFEKMLMSSGISAHIVNNSKFKEFFAELDPDFQMPRTDTLKMDLDGHCESVETKLKNLLNDAAIIITSFDFWITKSMVTYLSVNAHYVTKSWDYEHKLLTLKRIFGTPNEAAIIDEYELILNKFGINNVVYLNVASNSVNVLGAFQLKFTNVEEGDVKMLSCDSSSCEDGYTFDQFLDVNNHLNIETFKINGVINRSECFVHTLMFVIKESIQTVPVLIKTLQICGEILSFIRLSDLVNEELKLLLQQCLDARQISVLHMFQRFFDIYSEISSILLQSGFDCWLLSQAQLEVLDEFIEVLQPFLEAIDFLFNDSLASISKCLPTILALRRHLQLLVPIHLKPLKQALITNLEKQFQKIYDDPVHVIPTILHPAWKMIPFIHVDMQLKAKEILIKELSKISVDSIDRENLSSKEIKLEDPEPDAKKSRLSLMFQSFKSNNHISLPDYEIELESYLKDDQIEEDANPLVFWKLHESKYPYLSTLSRKYLAIPAISMPIEKIRTLTEDVIKDRTNFITGDLFCKTAVIKYNLDLF